MQEVEDVLQQGQQGQQAQRVTWEEGYSAPLYARVHMRLGMWQWTTNSSEARPSGGQGFGRVMRPPATLLWPAV